MSSDNNTAIDLFSSEINKQTSKPDRSWHQRTFGKMDEGALRGNIFLMTLSTVGSAFFYLPYMAKEIGICTLLFLLALPAFTSYYFSYKLYYGFKATKAKTYDECMKEILGPKLGYLSNVVIFMHD